MKLFNIKYEIIFKKNRKSKKVFILLRFGENILDIYTKTYDEIVEEFDIFNRREI